ncbi:unnamed protein product [Linum trigynum]|uniref:RNase H type-1 domain-containing protein n=1 Tax=Linum trigynum TaxID=586398 RepID=A0AAV2CR78_9ROSI
MEERFVPDCPYCGIAETQEHRFMECEWSRRIWRRSLWLNMCGYGNGEEMSGWLNKLLTEEDTDMIAGICSLLWFLWDERNKHQFNGKKLEEGEVAIRAQNWILEYKREQELQNTPRNAGEGRQHHWIPPSVGTLKVNTDAGCLGDAGTGLGMIVRDWMGEFRFAAATREAERWTPEVAEGRAVVFAIKKMKEL